MPSKLFIYISIFQVVFCMGLSTSNAQSFDSLSYEPTKLSYVLKQNGAIIGPNKAKVLMKDCPKGLKYLEDGRNYERIGGVLLVTGIAFTLVGAGNYYFNGQEEISYPTIGAGLLMLGVSFPMMSTGRRKITTGIFLYNKNCAR